MANIAQYGDFSLDDVDEIDKASSRGAAFFKAKEGKQDLRPLPARVGEKPVVMYWQHFINTPTVRTGFACPTKMLKKPCPVCDMARKLASSSSDADQKRAKSIWPRARYMINVIDRSNEGAGPLVWGFGSKIWEQLKALRTDTDVGGDFTHPDSGYDIRLTRKGTGQFDSEYTLLPGRPKPLTADAEKLKAWVAGQHDIRDFAKPWDYDKIMDAIGGGGGGGQQQAAPAGAGKLAGKGKPKADDDEDPWAAGLGDKDDPSNDLTF